MFYSDVILAKRGPLARVWLAAHWERKLSKTQFLQTSIEKSVTAIMSQEVVPMALRLSGQLLLGVVRIYSRKAKYLLEDCNEALLKIKMAFRSGAVDLTSDQLNVSRNAITLQDTRTDLDILLPDPAMENWDIDFDRMSTKKAKARQVVDSATAHTARASDITLPSVDYGAFEDDGFDLASTMDGIASQDFDPDGGLDLGLEDDLMQDADAALRDAQGRLVDENGDPIADQDDSMSIGVGRDAPSEIGRQSVTSMLNLGLEGDFTMGSEKDGSIRAHSLGPEGFDLGGDGLDLGLEAPDLEFEHMDIDLAAGDVTIEAPQLLLPGEPPATEAGAPFARSVTPSPSDNSMALALAEMTPQTAARIRDTARQQEEAANKQARAKKQIVDSLTELPESQLGGHSLANLSQGASQPGVVNVQDILTQERYLPRSRTYLRLLTIRQDPTSHYVPFADPSNKGKSSLYIGPSGLAPELTELFTFDLSAMRRRRRLAAITDEETGSPSKRLRLEQGPEAADDSMEVARRAQEASRRESLGLGPLPGYDDEQLDMTLGLDDGSLHLAPLIDEEGLELGFEGENGEEGAAPRRSQRKSKSGAPTSSVAGDEAGEETGRLAALSRLSTPEVEGFDEQYDSLLPTLSNPLAGFDLRQNEDKPADEVSAAIASSEEAEANTQGWSKNTVRALRVLRSQLSADPPSLDLSTLPCSTEQPETATPHISNFIEIQHVSEEESESPIKKLSFSKISHTASRRAAAGFFFEMLVLGTKDCVQLEQQQAYKDIKVVAKPKLWATATGSVRS